MHKALTQMNIQLANVISDLSGVTGQMIVRAIVTGERDPRKLAELSHPRIQASRGEIAKSLAGNWRQELIFVLQQEIEMYDTYQRRVAECDQQPQKHLTRFADTVPPKANEEVPQKRKGKQNENNPHFHLADELQRITGVDLTRIDGVDVMVAQTLVSEVGLEPMENRGALRLTLCIAPSSWFSTLRAFAELPPELWSLNNHSLLRSREPALL
jgi:hypothetical protein